jgi:hypothetical protein
MLDVQSRLLRQLVKSHSQLKDQWKQSRERLLVSPGVGEENAITLGESHVILELQMSNQVSNFSLCLPFLLISKHIPIFYCVISGSQSTARAV